MIAYILISIIYCATFIAWMKVKENDETYVDSWGDWHPKYIILCVLGTILWPLIIPFIFLYRIALKVLNKINKNNK